MTAKDFIIKKAQEAVNSYYQLNPSVQDEADKWFTGTCSADFTTIEDPEGHVYTLYFTGSPQPISRAFKLSDTEAFVKGQAFPIQQVTQQNNKGYLLYKDSLWFYICKLGSADKYYLPYCLSLKNRDMSSAQAMFSSDGKAVLIGTVLENLDSDFPTPPALIYHQIARYGIFPDIKLVDNTSAALQTAGLAINGLDYPPGVTKIAWCDVTKLKDIAFNCNTMTDTFVPAPAQQVYSARGMFFPYSTSLSLYYQFLTFINENWAEDSGSSLQFVYQTAPDFGGFQNFYAKRYTSGNQNFNWNTPDAQNTSLFKNFQYVFNNDLSGSYNADLALTHVNCYFFGMTQMDWFTEFYHEYQGVYVDSPYYQGNYGDQNYYYENRQGLFSYTVPNDYAYTLEYLLTPDIWLPANVVSQTGLETWIKNGEERLYSTVTSDVVGNVIPYDLQGTGRFDAIAYQANGGYYAPVSTYYSFTGNGGVHGFNLAYTSTQTLGPPFQGQPYCNADSAGDFESFYANYYTGLQRKYRNYYNYIWSAYSIWYSSASVPPIWIDLCYTQLFQTFAPASYAVFAGRSTTIIKNLGSTPTLYGIITQLLQDGADYNALYYAFRGRDFSSFTKTALVYKQDFNKVYRLQSPYLVQGNLSGIPGTGKADLADQAASDPYGSAIATLIDTIAIAEVYDDIATANIGQTLVNYYRNQQIPPQSLLDSYYNGLLNITSDLQGTVNQLRTALNGVNGALSGETTLYGIDVIGYSPPDVFTEAVFATSGNFPYQKSGRYLKGLDSWIIQGYYVEGTTEYIQNYNVSDGTDGTQIGLTTLGKKATGVLKTRSGQLYDYILPLAVTETKG